MVKTRQWILVKKPTDMPKLDGPDATFKLIETDLPDLKDDELLVKTAYMSNDPAQRGWISPSIKADRLYVPPVQEGAPMNTRALAEVVESKSSSYKKGDWVVAGTGWSEYAIIPAKQAQPAPDLPGGLSRTHYLGALGMTGLTAYFGLTEIGKAKKDDIVVVSGAAGATGNMVVQIAKNIIGCKKVIGIAGSDEKCKWVESLGADLCLNYKSSSFADDLAKALPGPDGYANVYFDNVGGEILDLMFTRMARFSHIVACGSISSYNSTPERTTGLKNWFEIITMRVECRGFIVIDFMSRFQEAIGVFKKALGEGKLKIGESEHIVKGGFEDVPKTWMQLFEGSNTGKLITALQ
ncbi:hypothetical protein LTR36_002667 [Oleoguttula mirabilis]|uniref:Enoyl reductase (ER) domain-containing protein n=1 Tax=Oleoguttula mirabilis TaxID=1507867 RepID=A0AAV9JJU4_9PEZI|nr:hypothetical protein LTR36_002667 [Oleoguttula mirabilis]